MTQPRMVLAGSTLLITRRSVSRHYLFRPDSEISRAFRYCLALAAEETGVILHAAVLLSTHYHLVVTDVFGRHPDFTRRLNRLFANFTKVHRGWAGEVFNAAGPSVVTLHTPDSVVDKIGYTLANPVAAGAVRAFRDWPGVVTRVEDIGSRSHSISRPSKYFAADSSLPKTVTLRFELPALCTGQEDSVRQSISSSVLEHEAAARKLVEAEGGSFQGPERLKRFSPYKRAKTYEVFGSRNPALSTKGSGLAGLLAAVAELQSFRNAYRAALDQWRAGIRDVLFPTGTWLMRVLHRACVAPA